jgi:hypothetical protein
MAHKDRFYSPDKFNKMDYMGSCCRIRLVAEQVRENGLFNPFAYKNAHFTKTGSGQT